MPTTVAQRATILVLLAVALSATRLHHFALVPDASWAVFFVAGFYLRDWVRGAFPALMALAVLVDVLVVTSQGTPFWQSYCVSPAYAALLPAYYALWAGGQWLARGGDVASPRRAARLLLALPLAVVACHLVAQGSFYWISANIAEPTVAGWWENFTTWLVPYLRVTAAYVALVALAHVAIVRGAPLFAARRASAG